MLKGGKFYKTKVNLIKNWDYIFKKAKENNIVLIFDDLCIEQINDTGYKFNREIFDKYYLGEDGTTSMYIDLVNMNVSKNSIIYKENYNNYI